jgi:hypothetical protein
LEFEREFLSLLHPEFEPRHAQLLARGRVPLAKETHLRGAGLLGVSSVLAGRVAPMLDVTSMPSHSSAQPQLVAPSNGMGRSPSGGGGVVLLIFSVAILRSQGTMRLIATRICWTWPMLLRPGLVRLLRVPPICIEYCGA